jgi:hypothetical protein
LLRSRGIQTVILTGVATNVCVESTGRDVYMHDYYLVFVSDGTATTSQAASRHHARQYRPVLRPGGDGGRDRRRLGRHGGAAARRRRGPVRSEPDRH